MNLSTTVEQDVDTFAHSQNSVNLSLRHSQGGETRMQKNDSIPLEKNSETARNSPFLSLEQARMRRHQSLLTAKTKYSDVRTTVEDGIGSGMVAESLMRC